MNTFIFVHGAWHGSWCWDKVIKLVQNAGHNAVAVDLPCRAGDETKHSDVTVATYAETICNVINLQSGSVILVGHSMGGMMISQASEYCSSKIAKLVFVSGFLPETGESLLDLANHDTGSRALVLPNLTMNEDEKFSYFESNAPLYDIFYNDCNRFDINRATAMLVPEALSAFGIPVQLTDKSLSVKRYYIECLQDNAIPIDLQRYMYGKFKCEKIFTIDSSHSPFLSKPKELVKFLLSI